MELTPEILAAAAPQMQKQQVLGEAAMAACMARLRQWPKANPQ